MFDPYNLVSGSVIDPYDYWGEGTVPGGGGSRLPTYASQGTLPVGTLPQRAARNTSQNIGRAVTDAGGAVIGFADSLVAPTAQKAQSGLVSALARTGSSANLIPEKANVLRMAGSPRALAALKIGTGLAAAGSVVGAGDIILGNDSAANKVMDAAAMGIGGFLGAAGGPMGIAAGAGLGKTASDSLQWLFGDKKTAEQRQMEQALAGLQGGRI